jgi:hypothetical protein
MSRAFGIRVVYLSIPVVALLILLVTGAQAHAEGGTWPPVGQLAGGTPLKVAVQGDYAYVASKQGYVTQTKANVVVTSGQTTYVNFNLEVSGKLKGQVTEQGTGIAIIGATVSARTGGVVRAVGTTAGPYGMYEISSDLPAGTYTMLCTKAGYQDSSGATTYVDSPLQAK